MAKLRLLQQDVRPADGVRGERGVPIVRGPGSGGVQGVGVIGAEPPRSVAIDLDPARNAPGIPRPNAPCQLACTH